MRILGYSLFTLGIILAVSGGAKLPPSVEQVSYEEVLQAIAAMGGDAPDGDTIELRIGEDRIRRWEPSDENASLLYIVGTESVEQTELDALLADLKKRNIPFLLSNTSRVPRFPDTWPICLLGVVCAVVGVVLWRIASRAEAAQTTHVDRHGTVQATPQDLLVGALKAAHLLQGRIDGLSAQEIEHRIDDLLEQHILPFADMRQRVIDHFGMSLGAEILVATAVAERMLNRTWSAAADGYPAEARASYSEAVAALEESERLWEAAES
jgi:hypothetical protein